MCYIFHSLALFCLCFGGSLAFRLMLASICVLAGVSGKLSRPGLPGIIFLVWLGWALICSTLSPWPEMSLNGFLLRREGWFTFAVATCFALSLKNHIHLIPFAGIIALALPWAQVLIDEKLVHEFMLMPVPQGALAAGLLCVSSVYHPSLGIIFAPMLLGSGQRSAFIAVVAVLFWQLVFGLGNRAKCMLWVIMGCLAVGLAVTPLGNKLVDTRFNFTGSRTQWLLQADTLAKALPLTGYGLDTGSKLLRPATGPTAHPRVLHDRTHNMLADILLFTGWPGLTMILLCLGACIATTIKFPTETNRAALSGVLAIGLVGMFNPIGIPAWFLMLACVFKIRK